VTAPTDRTVAGRCVCGHLDVFHGFGVRSDVRVRTGCSWVSGGGVCVCPLFEAAR
jgi:hypothetical protein